MYPRRQLASRFVHLASLFSPGNREEDRLVLVLPPFVFTCPFAARRAVIRIDLPDNRLLLRRRIYHRFLSFTGQLNGKFVLFFRPNRRACICIFTRIVFHHCTDPPGCTTCFLRWFFAISSPWLLRCYIGVELLGLLVRRNRIRPNSILECSKENRRSYYRGSFVTSGISDSLSVQDRLIVLFRRGRTSHPSCSNFCRAAIVTRGLALSWRSIFKLVPD